VGQIKQGYREIKPWFRLGRIYLYRFIKVLASLLVSFSLILDKSYCDILVIFSRSKVKAGESHLFLKFKFVEGLRIFREQAVGVEEIEVDHFSYWSIEISLSRLRQHLCALL
jgi:hypothetical protein